MTTDTAAEAMAKAINRCHSTDDPYYGTHRHTCLYCGETKQGSDYEGTLHLHIKHKPECVVLLARQIIPVEIPDLPDPNRYYCGRDS